MTPEMLSLSNSPLLFVVAMLVKIFLVFGVLMGIVAYATYAERKIIGRKILFRPKRARFLLSWLR